ncbi:glutathione S-transferase [Sneathiella chinensis]|uniref:Glutathione S-transferase n=1 Tax=Sneathiella chinensis TaxID=349750 RepID=A0ABQ5U1C2_9PROT|nr:glutathione S-transferase [Sneathiella chinensis]GLQ05518.1 glutathione S-transferase [Sneathiella chinensis]
MSASFSSPSPDTLPVLYSFRRCPYAMRARLALAYSGEAVELRDILLKDKPAEMIAASPKATVPVLVLQDGTVIEESIDIVWWALGRSDPMGWLPDDGELRSEAHALIQENDGPFKSALDKYKYFVRFPEKSQTDYRQSGEEFLAELERRLEKQAFLLGDRFSVADAAIFPFIRQFANSDRDWFKSAPYPKLQQWLEARTSSDGFSYIMKKRPIWQPDTPGILFPDCPLTDF